MESALSRREFKLRFLTLVFLSVVCMLVFVALVSQATGAEEWSQQLLLFCFIVAGLVLGLVEIRRLNQRLVQLADVTAKIGKGDFGTRVTITRDDAVGGVGKAVNEMAARIEASMAEIERSKTELETAHACLETRNREISEAYAGQVRFGEFLSDLYSIDITALAETAVKHLSELVNAHLVLFYLFDPEKQKLVRIACRGVDRHALESLGKKEHFEGLPAEAFSRRETIELNDIEPDTMPSVNLGFARVHLKTIQAIPLLFQEKAFGVLLLASLNEPPESARRAFKNHVDALAHAVNNALTHQAVETQAGQLAQHNSKLQGVDHRRLRFVANMNHELRTPLNSILGFSNLLLKNRAGNLRNEDIDYLTRIQRGGKHLLELINEILDLSRIEAGKSKISVGPVQLGPFLREIVELMKPQAELKNLALELDIPNDDAVIETDESKLRQVLLNLMGNAVKFTSQGKVSLAVREEEQEGCVFSVSDTGPGIPEEKINEIFEAFSQVSDPSVRHLKGTGLGLTISRTMVQLLGGRIEVSSQEGKGSSFRVHLPSNTASTPNRASSSEEAERTEHSYDASQI